PTGDGRNQPRDRRGRSNAWGEPVPDHIPRAVTWSDTGNTHRLCTRLWPRGRGIWFGDLYRGQHPLCVRDRHAPHLHNARRVQLSGGHSHRHVDAVFCLHRTFGDQSYPDLVETELWPCELEPQISTFATGLPSPVR